MHNFVQRIMRGVIFCSVTIAITACAGFTDQNDRNQSAEQPILTSNQGLSRIDAIRLRVGRNAAENGAITPLFAFLKVCGTLLRPTLHRSSE